MKKHTLDSFSAIKILFLLYIIPLCHNLSPYNPRPPKLTVIMVVDQFAHQYLATVYPNLKYGLRYILDHGIHYTNAHVPHAKTAASHASLNTGTYAKDHGIIGNKWVTSEGKKVACDDDTSPDTLVFSPNSTDSAVYDYGKSPHYLMIDGLTDQYIMQSSPQRIHRSFSISGKSRSAILTANKLGKGIWIDGASGLFTSSQFYFDQLPDWLIRFNAQHNPSKQNFFVWQRLYPKSPFAYNFFNTNNYDYSRIPSTMFNTQLPIYDAQMLNKPYHFFEQSPLANAYILNCAQACISKHVNRKNKDSLLLWVCLSPLDKLVHQYGPNSMEALDMIYHLDKQLKRFIRHAYKAVGKHNVLLALTADHGIMPLPEILNNNGLTIAQRVSSSDVLEQLNTAVQDKENQNIKNDENFIIGWQGQELIFNRKLAKTMPQEDIDSFSEAIKKRIYEYPWVKQLWDRKELAQLQTDTNTIEHDIKNQIFPKRSGDIILQPYPYTLLFGPSHGTGHKSSYNYDTHVPLIVLYPGRCEKKYVRERVSTMQVANTCAELLNIPKPSASTAEVLPDLFDPEYQ